MKSLSALKGIILLYADILKYDDLDFWKRVLVFIKILTKLGIKFKDHKLLRKIK